MKFILCVFLCCIWWSSPVYSITKIRVGLGEPNIPANRNVVDSEDKWFVQKLNHFDPTNTKTWKQVFI